MHDDDPRDSVPPGREYRDGARGDATSADTPRQVGPRAEDTGAEPLAPRPRGGVRGVTVGLLLLLAMVGLLAPRLVPEPQLQRVQQAPPEPTAPVGALAEAYELARPAALRIEARCVGDFRHGALGVGSGFYVSPQGDVLTAYHVVESDHGALCPLRYVAVSPDGSEAVLELVGFDAYFDLAWMRAEVDHEVPYLELADNGPRRGTEVVAIGNSRGDFLQPRAGRITRLGVQASRADFADGTIELTAALAPGDSGGPVVNAAGEAVGVVSYISFTPGSLESDAYVPPFLQGLTLPGDFASYAVPVSIESDLVSALRHGDRRDVPVIGFSWQQGFDYRPGPSDGVFGRRPGPIVVSVAPGGPADQAGLRGYRERPLYSEGGDLIGIERDADVIVAVDGEATPTFWDLMETVRRKSIGDTVQLTVQRGPATLRLDLTLGAKRDVFARQ